MIDSALIGSAASEYELRTIDPRVFVSWCWVLGVRLLVFVLGDELAAASPPARTPLYP
jgi:hypothetical protein